MRQSSIIIHKGRKEEKYEIYVEDYVISFLKEKAGTPDEGEILFYGCREKGGRQYTIYGAGRDRQLAVFDKYDLLDEIGCRLTQAGPVFLVKEANGTYEVKGYKVFYYENEEMQDYLIQKSFRESRPERGKDAAGRGPGRKIGQAMNPHYAVTLQLGLVFVALVAIVINSANSYDKMKQLNQSAEEVFFVMENQEAETPEEDHSDSVEQKENDIVIEREDSSQESEGQARTPEENMLLENAAQGGAQQEQEEQIEAEISQEEQPADTAGESGVQTGIEEEKADSPEETENTEEEGEGVEALSRNVARYYEVERGDTLYKISQKIYGDTSQVKKICEINQIADPDNIRYGQKIILP